MTKNGDPETYRGIRVMAHPGLHGEIAGLLPSYIATGAQVLDVGAGAGAFSLRMSDMGYDVTALDMSEDAWSAEGVRFVFGCAFR